MCVAKLIFFAISLKIQTYFFFKYLFFNKLVNKTIVIFIIHTFLRSYDKYIAHLLVNKLYNIHQFLVSFISKYIILLK